MNDADHDQKSSAAGKKPGKNKQGFDRDTAIGLVALLGIAAFFGYRHYNKGKTEQSSGPTTQAVQAVTSPLPQAHQASADKPPSPATPRKPKALAPGIGVSLQRFASQRLLRNQQPERNRTADGVEVFSWGKQKTEGWSVTVHGPESNVTAVIIIIQYDVKNPNATPGRLGIAADTLKTATGQDFSPVNLVNWIKKAPEGEQPIGDLRVRYSNLGATGGGVILLTVTHKDAPAD